jgi:hypothetical protein
MSLEDSLLMLICNILIPITVAAHEPSSPAQTLGSLLESHSRHGCLYGLFCVCVVCR